MQPTIDLTSRASYTYFETEKIRFSDTDMLGHVNNVAFAALLESGRTAYGQNMLAHHMPNDVLIVMARVEIDYRREVHWPSTVDIGCRITNIGRTSYIIGQGIFLGDTCTTTGRTTLVIINRQTRRPTPMSDPYRQVLESLL